MPHGEHNTKLTAFRLPDNLKALAKGDAKRAGITLTAWVIDAIERKLGIRDEPAGDTAEGGRCLHPANRMLGTFCAECQQDIE